MTLRYIYLVFILVFIWACNKPGPQPELITADNIAPHIKELAQDRYGGRMPCTQGDTLTVDYLVRTLKEMGIEAPPDAPGYTQDVPLVSVHSHTDNTMTIDFQDTTLILESGSDFVAHTQRLTDSIGIKGSELVFCGYGIVDESLGWNDYAGMDMKGKTAVVLVNDPGFGGEDEDFFRGDIMTYYGRWTYKYEEADRQGADGLLIIHETQSAGYPWFVVQSSWSGPQQGLAGVDRQGDCGVKGWITLDQAKKLFEQAGLDLGAQIRAARKPGFKPQPLHAGVSVGMTTSIDRCTSQNVIGYIKGSTYPDEYIVYTAHWDHIGIGRPVDGDSIYNGALDNASGTGALLAIAEAFAKSKTAPERSVVFLFVTAEEQGLLGSEHYVNNPLFPLDQTVANINLDRLNGAGEMNDLSLVGIGHSEMDEYAKVAAAAQNRYTSPEGDPEKGRFFRSDHFNFARKGVPALYAKGGYDHREKGKEYAMDFIETFESERYHAPADEYSEDWDMSGIVQDARLYYLVGQRLANNRDWPQWYPESEFSRPEGALKD